MQEIVEKNLCSGCHACYSICPNECISMKSDKEGFLYPQIDANKCVDCGLCKKVCPVINEYIANEKGHAYSCMNIDDEVRKKSSSGGIFTLLAEFIINKGGVVFGAGFSEDFGVKHICVKTKEELSKLRGSKYVQSEIGDAYKQVKSFLQKDMYVLFTGTPCQVSGLLKYLHKDYEKLYISDIICHGVPSPKLWNKYLEFRKKDVNACEINNISFREKQTGWRTYSVVIDYVNNKYIKKAGEDLYMKSFLENLCLRPSCYNCHSKSYKRQSDITLADFWGIWEVLPQMYDDKGTSLVLVNSKKGQDLFDGISDNMRYEKVDIDKALSYNSSAYKSAPKPKNRDKFMKMVFEQDINKATSKYLKNSKLKKYKNYLKNKIKKLIKRECNNV